MAGRIKYVILLFLLLAVQASAPAAPATFNILSEIEPARPLKPGEFSWDSEATATGELTVVIDLKRQLAHIYRRGHEIGVATISSGRRGYETPPGDYVILEKSIDHYSDLFDLAPMPYMQRLTWTGVALHGGKVPGYPASHGCVRLPEAFAHILYFETRLGGRVIVSPDWQDRAIPGPSFPDKDPAALRLKGVAE